MSVLVFSFKQFGQLELSAFATRVVQKMPADAQFTTLMPQVTLLKAALEAYNTAASIASEGGKDRTAEKNKRLDVLTTELVTVARHVDMLANGDGAVIVAAGFDVRNQRKAIVSIPRPTGLRSIKIDLAGAVELKWDKNGTALNFVIEKKPKDESWQNAAFSTTPSSTVLTGYEQGAYIEFRLKAIGRGGLESEYTAPLGVWVD